MLSINCQYQETGDNVMLWWTDFGLFKYMLTMGFVILNITIQFEGLKRICGLDGQTKVIRNHNRKVANWKLSQEAEA